MRHKMLVEVTVEQDGGRSPVRTKDEQKKRLIAAVKKKNMYNTEKTTEEQRTMKNRRINRLGSHILFQNHFIFFRDENNSYLKTKNPNLPSFGK